MSIIFSNLFLLQQVFQMTTKAHKAIPGDYEQLVERKSIQNIKNVLFSKQTHQTACGEMDAIVAATSVLQRAVQCFGQLFQPAQLGQVKSHEHLTRQLRTYGATIHLLNLILHKFSGKSGREKAALARE